jgi:cell division protein FtsZ
MLDDGAAPEQVAEAPRRTEPALEPYAQRSAGPRGGAGRGEAPVRTSRTGGAPLEGSDDDHMEIPAFLRRQAN